MSDEQYTFTAPIAYPLCDALLAEALLLHLTANITDKRRTISSGSCVYIFDQGRVHLGRIYLRQSVNDNETFIDLRPGLNNASALRYLQYQLALMWQVFENTKDVTSLSVEKLGIRLSGEMFEGYPMPDFENPVEVREPTGMKTSPRRKTYQEDRRAVAELQEHPERKEEIHKQWSRAVSRNKNRTLSANSMASTWRRLVQEAKQTGNKDEGSQAIKPDIMPFDEI